MRNTINSLVADETATVVVEYGFLAMLVAAAAAVSVRTLGTNVSTLYSHVAGSI
jgi:Flp pilus assembly pilin Flp